MRTQLAPSHHTKGQSRCTRDARVLVTEDDTALRHLMTDVLVYQGYCVTEAANAFEMKREIIRSLRPDHLDGALDLVVSDVFMPGKTGLQALSELRRTGVTVPFLFVTCFPDMVTYEDVEKLDVQLLTKPFTLDELRLATAALLNVRQSGSGMQP